MSIVNMSSACQNTETSAATELARAREARRRRVLGGAASRLALIAGRPAEAEDCPLPHRVTPPPPDVTDDASVFEIDDRLGVDDIQRVPLPDLVQESPPKLPPFLNVFLRTRLHIFIYSILVQAVFTVGKFEDAYVFFPLFMWEFAESFYFQTDREDSFVDKILAMVSGSSKYGGLFKVVKLFKQISEDALLYIFTIVLSHLFLFQVGIKR